MKASKWVVAVCTSCLLPALAVAGESTSFDSATLRIAVQKGLGLLVKTSPNFIKRGGCNSCHNQFLPAMAQAVARKRGIDAGPDIAQMEGMQMDFSPERALEFIVIGGANSIGYSMLNGEARRRPADVATDAFVHYLQSTQEPEGNWRTLGNRPPITYDDRCLSNRISSAASPTGTTSGSRPRQRAGPRWPSRSRWSRSRSARAKTSIRPRRSRMILRSGAEDRNLACL